jgi:putative two-component system response regulator
MLPLIFNFALIVLVTCLTYKYFTLKEKLIPVDDRLAVYIESFATIIDKFEAYENSHAHKMVQVAKAIAKEKNMSEEEIAVLHYTCLLHDIGQLMLPRELFKSSKKLDEDQIFLLRTHPLLGEIELRNAELPFDAVPVMIRWHHEKWDG